MSPCKARWRRWKRCARHRRSCLGPGRKPFHAQELEIATHEYVAALSDLRSHLGIPEYAASAEPNDGMTLPAATTMEDDEALPRMALSTRPEILAANAAAVSSRHAVRWPSPTGSPFPPWDRLMRRMNRA